MHALALKRTPHVRAHTRARTRTHTPPRMRVYSRTLLLPRAFALALRRRTGSPHRPPPPIPILPLTLQLGVPSACARWHAGARGQCMVQTVLAACLYTVCRRERTPHMLIDFSDALQTNL